MKSVIFGMAGLLALAPIACDEPAVESESPSPGVVILEPDNSGGIPELAQGAGAMFVAQVDEHSVQIRPFAIWSTTWTNAADEAISTDLGETDIDDQGYTALTTADLPLGVQEVSVEVTDSHGNTGYASLSVEVIEGAHDNLPPSMPTVIVEPLGADTDDALICQASGSLDPDGEPVSYSYTWDVDGSGHDWTGRVLDSTETEAGEQWTCSATPSDPWEEEGEAGYGTVVIGNSLPSYSSVAVSPTVAWEDTTLQCTPQGWFDPDGHAADALYEWWVNGIQASAFGDQLTGADFDRGDAVYCVVSPFDGTGVGIPLTSNIVTIRNTPPMSPTVQLQPSLVHYDEDIECVVTLPEPDLDGDTTTFTYQWLLDGALEPYYVGAAVPASATRVGDEWTCEVQVSDGTDVSGWSIAAATVLPYAGDLVITEVMSHPSWVDDTVGEYFEIYNTTSESLPLDGFEFDDGAGQAHRIVSINQATVAPGEYFVLGLHPDPAINGGVGLDYLYDSYVLVNPPATLNLTLSFRGVTVDQISIGYGGPLPEESDGRSVSLDPDHLDALGNDTLTSWCHAVSPVFEWGDFGTPGAANDDCDCDLSDSDGDHFGDDGSCPARYRDCDDNDGTVNPLAEEVCDGVDNDCDGEADLGGANLPNCTVYYQDIDGDGYGQEAAPGFCLCSANELYRATQTGDCYDYNADANPDATEFSAFDRGDGSFDFNCDGVEERQYPDALSCSYDFGHCDATGTWAHGVPDCGVAGLFTTTCLFVVVDCYSGPSSEVFQACK